MSVRVERDGPVWTVVLARPEVRNAVDRETADELSRAFRGFEAETEARVAVLWGEGGCFSAGADLRAIAALPWSCLVNDRRRVYDGQDLPLEEALENETRLGLATLGADGGREAARRFRRDDS